MTSRRIDGAANELPHCSDQVENYLQRSARRNFFSIPFRPAGPRGARFSLCRDVIAFCGLTQTADQSSFLGAFK
jgi:hypothetical protein